MYKKIVIIAVVGMILWSCKKDPEPVVLSEKTKLIIGSWKIKRINPDNPVYACLKDVILKFQQDGTLTSEDGPQPCNTGGGQGQQVSKATWSFQKDEKQIKLPLCGTGNCDLVKLTTDSLIVTSYSAGKLTYYLAK
ncbi:MAG: hypothetical protein QM536_07155 [Chitinophagaceae bacterium]|nr:hypothetical protein [Chitinophagaceae bacterium]